MSKAHPTTPPRQVRALYDEDTITVYQAYPPSIAIPAVTHQNLSASPDFSTTRMTWIKPSWCWMMYRSGYSYKDPRQTHILALKIKHENFKRILSEAIVTDDIKGSMTAEQKNRPVRVQWDPERDPRLKMLLYRSIQIGISGDLGKNWVHDWIESIEDVTDKARVLKEMLDRDESLGWEELVDKAIVPVERPYPVDEELRKILGMEK